MKNFKKYKQNLSIVTNSDGKQWVQSYTTRVAEINHETKELIQLGYWSVTTQKHINYAAAELNYELIK